MTQISVILPAFGAMPDLESTVASVVRQVPAADEVIVSHSGPNDPTDRLAEASPTVRVVHSPERRLPGAARNAGAAVATSPWLAFLDGDMHAEPGWLSAYRAVADMRGDRSDVVLGSIARAPNETYLGVCMWFIESGSSHPYRPPAPRTTGPGATFLISKAAFEAVGGFREDWLIGEDADFFHRVRHAGHAILFHPSAAAAHPFAGPARQYMRRLFALGRAGARVRRGGSEPGTAAVRYPMLAPLLLPARIAQIYARVLGRPGAPVGALIWHTPGILYGLVGWTAGFTLEAFGDGSGKR